MKKTIVPIKGMHCRSCELMIEDELKEIPGVSSVSVSEKRACAEICYEDELKVDDVDGAIQKAGYAIGYNEKKPLFSKDFYGYMDIFFAALALFYLYILVKALGLSSLFSAGGGHPTSLVTVFVIGLTAGLSTCMALIGGLVLGTATRFAQQHPEATNKQRFIPHLWFTGGRIVSYTVLGGVIGGIGSFFQFSGLSLGLLTLAVALVMLTLGMQLTGLFPRLENFKFTLPKEISKILGIKESEEYSHKNSFLLGTSTFFLPCGFTQAMQLYAMSSGNVFTGAAIMGIFALGTAPGLLGIGGLTSVLRGVFAQKFFKFAGVAVMGLSLFNINNALNLIGWNSSNVLAAGERVVTQNNQQIVRMTQDGRGYTPNSFTITNGIPVKWIINSTDVNTCASSIISSAIGVRKNLHPGENIIEFTPKKTGTINFSCSMGMYRGSFTVVEQGEEIPAPVVKGNSAGSCDSGGCGCGGGVKPQVEQIAPEPVVENKEQVIKTTYANVVDISPNTFTVKRGIPVRLEIEAKDDGVGCMSAIMVSGFTQPEFLEKGKTITFTFTPTSAGEFPITCAMGMPRGVIKVI